MLPKGTLGFVIAASWLEEQSPRKAVGLFGPRSHVVRRCSAPVPRWSAGGAEGTVATEQRFCFIFALASYLSFLPAKYSSALSCLANNFWEVYPHENRSKLIEIGSLHNADIHVSLLNPQYVHGASRTETPSYSSRRSETEIVKRYVDDFLEIAKIDSVKKITEFLNNLDNFSSIKFT